MFNLKYNLLAGLNVGLSLLNFLVFIKIFGISEQSDAYLVANTIIFTLHLLELLLIEQFLVFYNEKKALSFNQGYQFYNSFVNFSLIAAVVFFMLFVWLSPWIIELFAQGFNNVQMELLELFFSIVLFELLIFPLLTVNQKLLNAESNYGLPYLLSILPNAAVTLVGVYLLLSGLQQAQWLLVAKVVFMFLATLISCIVIFKIYFKEQSYALAIVWGDIYHCVKNSVSMRFGHNIHNMLFLPLITNALSHLPVGSNSYFFYCYRLINMIANVATGPAGTILNAQMARAWVEKNSQEAARLIKHYLKMAPAMLIAVGLLVYLMIPVILPLFDGSFSVKDINILSSVFLLLLIWQSIIVVESPSVSVLIANKVSYVFVLVNSIFLIMFYGFISYLWQDVTVEDLVLSMIFAQSISLVFYYSFSRKVFLNHES